MANKTTLLRCRAADTAAREIDLKRRGRPATNHRRRA